MFAPVAGVKYHGFVDPSGGTVDTMTLAVAHPEHGRGVVDCVVERRPPFSPDDVTREFAAPLAQYGMKQVIGDRYGGEWPRERFCQHGIVRARGVAEEGHLLDPLALLNRGTVELLDSPRLLAQLGALERRTARGGRDIIDHAPSAHDDLANAAGGALTLLRLGARPRAPQIYFVDLSTTRPTVNGAAVHPAPVPDATDKDGEPALVFGGAQSQAPRPLSPRLTRFVQGDGAPVAPETLQAAAVLRGLPMHGNRGPGD